MQDADGLATAPLGADAGFEKGLHIGQRAAVQNRQLQVVQFHNHVVNAHADERGKQVFGGGDEYALAHEAGGVTDFGNIAARGGNFKVIQVGAAEDDARSSGRRQQTHSHRRAGVKPHARKLDGRGNGLLQVRGISQ